MAKLLSSTEINALLNPAFDSPVTISGVTNATPMQVNCAAVHGLVTGDFAVVANVATAVTANGLWRVTKVDDDSVTLDGSTAGGVGTSGTIKKVTAGMVGRLKPGDLKDLLAALDRVSYVQAQDADRSAESVIDDIL